MLIIVCKNYVDNMKRVRVPLPPCIYQQLLAKIACFFFEALYHYFYHYVFYLLIRAPRQIGLRLRSYSAA